MSSDNKPKPQDEEVSQDMQGSAEELVQFLTDSKAKAAMKDFVIETYKSFEAEQVKRFQAKIENERQIDAQSPKEFHRPGNISPLMAEALNMNQTETSFARALRATQANLTRSVDERVEEINRLLAGIGGFCSQLKSCFARSTVVFLEQEDPRRPHRERLIFSINLPNYELKSPLGRGANNQPEKTDKTGQSGDPRSAMQATWDNSVNALAQIIESTSLKPKYVKNDRHFGRFIMKQDLLQGAHMPDEYFSFILDYNTAEKIKEMCGPYNKIVTKYDRQMAKIAKSMDWYPSDSKNLRFLSLKKQYLRVQADRDYFVGSTPDPNQLDEGLLFIIEVSTTKDYQIVKDRMQSIMTKYILHLSKIAAHEAELDPNLAHELDRLHAQHLNRAAQRKKIRGEQEEMEVPEGYQEYEVDIEHLKPVKRKKAG